MSQRPWHHFSCETVLEEFKSSARGLSSQEATRRKLVDEPNSLPKKAVDHWLEVLARQFMNPLIIVLLIAGVLSAILNEWMDAGVIAGAVLFNTLIGFIQEYKANKSFERLQSLVLPRCMVLRDGLEREIDAREIMSGDVLILRTGDRVSADARLLEAIELSVDESTLTGESAPVSKMMDVLSSDTILAQRRNMVFAGTSIVGGRGFAVVVATGSQTELGKIATLVEDTKETPTPLQTQVVSLARWITGMILALVFLLFVMGLFSGHSTTEMFSMAVALSVAAIPEGLAVSVTIILAIGMQRILRRKSLVRKLVAAETLGSVSIICTDKTGTITQGQMRVTHIITTDQLFMFSALPAVRPQAVEDILRVMALCNDATLDGQITRGSQTEQALLLALRELGVDTHKLISEAPRTAEIPFDSVRKYMVTANSSARGSELLLKGALDRVLPFATRVLVDGNAVDITPAIRQKIENQELELTRQGLRLVAIARKSVSTTVSHVVQEEMCGFIFLGFVGLRDPLRPEAKEQIEQARRAGVETIIVTGDHPETARAIGLQAGLLVDLESVVTGSELDTWNDEQLLARISNIRIFARVEPRHKIRIVRAWQARGEVVAMTGDGVNDAPALKAADIGIALGSGSEVAKQSSDLVILDNNLSIITAAIEEGRVIFDNIRKTTVYLLAGSFTEIVLIGGSILLGLPLPLMPAQILWINLVADSFPSAGLALEPGERGVMQLAPRRRKEPVLNRGMLTLVFIIGIVTNLGLFALYLWLLNTGENIETIRSIMFAAVGIDSLIYVFAVKSFHRTLFRINPFSNPWLLLGVGMGFALIALALLTPFFQTVLKVVPLALSNWSWLLMIGAIKLVAIEVGKKIFLSHNDLL